MSEKTTIYDTLGAIQSQLHAPKGQENKFGGYRYRSAEDILEALKPLLTKHNASLTLSDEIQEVGGRVYVVATVLLATSYDHSISVTAWAREAEDRKGMDASQITGAASSYARKYALNGMFAIDDTKDADATNDHGKQSAPSKPASKPQQPAKPAQAKPKASTPAKKTAKASGPELVAKRIEADKKLKWFEIAPFERGALKGMTLGDAAAEGMTKELGAVLEYIDPVALDYELAVDRLKSAIAEAQNKEVPTQKDPQTGQDVTVPF